jgi:folylpolyglutamate synthase/dihydropteroate synthase
MTSEKRVNGDRLSEEETQTRVFLSVSDAVQFVESISPAHVAVLVTGSLHLVGTIMRVLNFTVDDV